MSVKRLPSLAELPHRVRAGIQELPPRCRAWCRDLRDDPGVVWRSYAFRLGAFTALGFLLILGLWLLVGALTPGGRDQSAPKAAPLTIAYVACTNPACHAEYIIKQHTSSKEWPLRCEKCGQKTTYRATRCPRCGHWYAVAPGGPPGCPFCAEKTKPPPPKEPERDRSRDAGQEDPW